MPIQLTPDRVRARLRDLDAPQQADPAFLSVAPHLQPLAVVRSCTPVKEALVQAWPEKPARAIPGDDDCEKVGDSGLQLVLQHHASCAFLPPTTVPRVQQLAPEWPRLRLSGAAQERWV